MSEAGFDRVVDATIENRLEAHAGYSPHVNRIQHQTNAENDAVMAADRPTPPTYMQTGKPYDPDTLPGAQAWENIICNVCRKTQLGHGRDGECLRLRRDYTPYYLGMTHETEPSGRDRRAMEWMVRSE